MTIFAFKQSCERLGIRFTLTPSGGLSVSGAGVSPVLADEIRARAPWLVKLVRIGQLLGRPLLVDEADELEQLGAELGLSLGWEHLPLGAHDWRPGRMPQEKLQNASSIAERIAP